MEREAVQEELQLDTPEPCSTVYSDFRPGGVPIALVCCLHGFPDTSHTFELLAPALRAAGYRVIVPTLRGYHPRSAGASSFTLDALADDTLRLIRKLDVSYPVHIVGHDWGAAIAARCGLREPELFASLSLLAVPHNFLAGAIARPQQLLRSWYMMFFQLPWIPEWWLTRGGGLDFLLNHWSPGWPGTEPTAQAARNHVRKLFSDSRVLHAAVNFYRQNVISRWVGGRLIGLCLFPLCLMMVLLLRVIRGPNARGWALEPPLRLPVLGLVGSSDGCIGPEVFDAAMMSNPALFPKGVDVHVIQGAGHWLHLEKPKEVIHADL